jgi:hypothetical protein
MYKNRVTLYNDVYNEFFTHKDCLIISLRLIMFQYYLFLIFGPY